MKTLDQVEARTPINPALPFIILNSGSYYLTGNLTVSSGYGILILADNVTLDLNGFTISSTASPTSGSGVTLNGVRRNVTVKNGHIRGTTTFAAGVFTTGGFVVGIVSDTLGCANLYFADVNVSSVAGEGISTVFSQPSSRTIVEHCSVSVCAGSGLAAGSVMDCHVDTAGQRAIQGDRVTNCFGESVGTGGSFDGIYGYSVVENCRGIANAGVGINGINAQVSNSFGTSVSGTGLVAICALNCQGISTSGAFGLQAVSGTASFCRGQRNGGVAISATNAIGCTVVGTGTVTAVNKSLGTP